MRTDPLTDLRQRIQSTNTLLQENIRDMGPEFRSQQYRREIQSLQQALHREQIRQVREPEEFESPGPPPRIWLRDPNARSFGDLLREYYPAEMMRQELERPLPAHLLPREDPWRGTEFPIPLTWGRPMGMDYSSLQDQLNEVERKTAVTELTFMGCRITMDKHAPDHRIYHYRKVYPRYRKVYPRVIQHSANFGGLYEPQFMGRPEQEIQSHVVDHNVYEIPDWFQGVEYVRVLEQMISEMRRASFPDLKFDLIVSPHTLAELVKALDAKRPLNELVLGPEGKRFEDQMNVALEEFAKERAA